MRKYTILGVSVVTLLLGLTLSAQAQQSLAEQLVKAQLQAYNQRDIDAFLTPYSDSVRIYNFPDQLKTAGIEDMRDVYGTMFDNLKDLHCEVLKRQVLGNIVIDHERVTFTKTDPPVEVLALYKTKADKIVEVHFIRPDQPSLNY